jgi:hypothetical protein
MVAAPLLEGPHAALASQFAVSKVDEEVSVLLDRYMMVERVILAELKALETVYGDLPRRGCGGHLALVEQQAVTPETREAIVNRLWADLKVASYLTVGHAPNRLHEDASIEVGPLLPVGSREGLTTEVTVTE